MSKTNDPYLQMLLQIRAHAISAMKAKHYSTFRIIWTIYMHEKRCRQCQQLRELSDSKYATKI